VTDRSFASVISVGLATTLRDKAGQVDAAAKPGTIGGKVVGDELPEERRGGRELGVASLSPPSHRPAITPSSRNGESSTPSGGRSNMRQ
jgi:hypothetical protein